MQKKLLGSTLAIMAASMIIAGQAQAHPERGCKCGEVKTCKNKGGCGGKAGCGGKNSCKSKGKCPAPETHVDKGVKKQKTKGE